MFVFVASSFKLFSATHLFTLAVIGLLLFAATSAHHKASGKSKRGIESSLAICCLLSHPLHIAFLFFSSSAITLTSWLPFHLCDLAAIICGLALLTRSQKLGEVAYFWGLAATLQGLITPNLSVTFPHPYFISFFWTHGFIVISALFLPLAIGLRPRKNSYLRVFFLTQLYALFAVCSNALLGTNYGFLASKPDSASVLDFFPEWPCYILILEILCISLLFLLQLPFSKKSEI